MDPSLSSPQVQQFITEQQQAAMANEVIGKLTSLCWDKCITGTPGNKFSSSKASCLSYCAQCYADMSQIILKKLQSNH